MTKRDKIIQKIKDRRNISFEEAEKILIWLGFETDATGSHHNFRKEGFPKVVTLKKRNQLKKYQLELIEEVLEFYGY